MTARPSSPPTLTLVQPGRKPRPKPTPASVKRLQDRARADARAIIRDLVASMEALAIEARSVAEMGDSAPVGVREIAPRIAEDMEHKALSIRRLIGG